MHPSDNSVIRTVKCEIGNRIIGRSTVIKDNFTFGIREPQITDNLSDTYFDREELEAQNRGCEFWCTLGDPSVKLLVENEQNSEES
jgi:hypothetical protein